MPRRDDLKTRVITELKLKLPQCLIIDSTFIGVTKPAEFFCSHHGKFTAIPRNALRSNPCKLCSPNKPTFSNSTLEDFVFKAISIYGDTYSYADVEYVNSSTKVTILCNVHGGFEEYPLNHIGVKRRGCPKCKWENRLLVKQQAFIEKAKAIHCGAYDYSNVRFKGLDYHVVINCPAHGSWQCSPHNHLAGHGCPTCSASKGERKVQDYLVKKGISHLREYKFPDCKYINPLPFDFYLPDLTTAIEYDGRQHFEPVNFKGRMTDLSVLESFQQTQARDKIKTDYCLQNGIQLIRIPYLVKDIDLFLNRELSRGESYPEA